MTKKCSGCSAEMVGGYKAKLNSSPLADFVVCGKGKQTKIDAYVCPDCGKVDFYVRNLAGENKKD